MSKRSQWFLAFLALVILYLAAWPTGIAPAAWDAPVPPESSGVYAPNTKLEKAEKLGVGIGHAGEDRDHFIREWGHAGDEHRPGTPVVISLLELGELGTVVIKIKDWLTDLVEQQRADAVPRHATRDRGDGAHPGN